LATKIYNLATKIFPLVASWLPNEKVNFEPCRSNVKQDRTFAIIVDKNILANTSIDPGQVVQVMPLFTTQVETLAADKHVIAKLLLVLFEIINLTRLTAGICMKVRFKSKVTRGFSFLPFHVFTASQLSHSSLTALSCREKSREENNHEKPLGPRNHLKVQGRRRCTIYIIL